MELTNMEVETGTKISATFKTKLEIDPCFVPQQVNANVSNKLGNKRRFLLNLQSKNGQQVPVQVSWTGWNNKEENQYRHQKRSKKIV